METFDEQISQTSCRVDDSIGIGKPNVLVMLNIKSRGGVHILLIPLFEYGSEQFYCRLSFVIDMDIGSGTPYRRKPNCLTLYRWGQ